jgi:alpha-methylacyl-CoA racemase
MTTTDAQPRGEHTPLSGIKVVDVSALGPGPFCSMLLSDYGADVVAVERPQRESFDPSAFFSRGKRSVVVDLRADGGADVIRRLAAAADVFLEGYRPGTMERRGLGPEVLLADNPRLVYTRLTGYGQDGPYALRAGHDINYIALAGPLGVIGSDQPVPPLNILGDFASGSVNAVTGVMLALFERERTGRGQVVDAAMVDGAAMLLTAQLAEYACGTWRGRGTSLLSGCAPFYGVYKCADGGWFAVGAIEDRFYLQLLKVLGLDPAELPDRDDRANWESLRGRFEAVFAAEPREHWSRAFADVDGCGIAVLDIDELQADPHLAERGTIAMRDGTLQAAPAPRLSGSAFPIRRPVVKRGQHTREVLLEHGFSDNEIGDLTRRGALPAD